MTIYLNYFKARPYIVDRQKYIEKHTTRTYNELGEISSVKYNAPHCLINVEGSYIEDYNILEAVLPYQRLIVNRFLSELKYPNNNNYKTEIKFRWNRN